MNIFKECILTKDKKYKLANCLSLLTLIVAFMFMVVGIFWSLYPYKPLVINERPVKVLTKEVKRNELLKYELDYCKRTDKRVTIKRKYQDGILFAIPDVETSNTPGCRIQTIAIEVPHSLPTGEYILVMEFVYKVNPIREVVVRTHTEKFTVIE